MRYYVFYVDSYDGGFVEVFDTEDAARFYVRKAGHDLCWIVKGDMIAEEL